MIEIGKLGQELFTRVSDMAEHAEDMGKSLKKAVEHYTLYSMIGSIETRVLVTTRKFKALGELSADDIPEISPITITTRELPKENERYP